MPPSASGVAPLPAVAAPTYAKLPLLRFVLRWLGIARILAEEKSLHSMLAAATPAGVVPFLEAPFCEKGSVFLVAGLVRG